MKGIWEHKWFIAPVGLFFLFGFLALWFVPYGDEILFFNRFRTEPYNTVFRALSWCGETWIWVVAGLTALFYRFRYTLIIALTGLIMPLVFVLKDQVGHDRPITYFHKAGKQDQVARVPEVDLNVGQTSFPSGHTMSAFGLCSLLALMGHSDKKIWGTPLALLAILVGISRIFLVQHFLADVLAGALLGLMVSSFTWWLQGRPYFQQKTAWDGRLRLWPDKTQSGKTV